MTPLERARRWHWPSITRDTVLLAAGLALLANEALTARAEKPTLILAALALMGIPLALRRDEREKR